MESFEHEARTSPDGSRRVTFYRSDAGYFSFEEETWTFEDMSGSGGIEPYHYWSCTHLSGLYGALEDAIRGAANDLRWYRDLAAS